MQAILATRAEDKLKDVAEQADRIHEIGGKAIVVATSTATAVTPSKSQPKSMEEHILTLTKQVAALTTQMTKMSRKWERDRA